MKFYIKQRIFTWNDKFNIYDQQGNQYLSVKGEVFSFGKKLHVFDGNNKEIAFVRERITMWFPKFNVTVRGREIGEIVQKAALFHNKYLFPALGWEITGNFMDHDYTICGGGITVASITKKWFSIGDSYEIDIADGIDPLPVLAAVLVIDATTDYND